MKCALVLEESRQPFSDAYVVKGGSIRKNTTLERGG